MPQTYGCDLCNQVPADFMITKISDGSTIAVGVECLLDFAVPLVEAFAAAQAHDEQTGAQAATEEPTGPDSWEEGYPQGRDPGGEPSPEGGEEGVEASERETAATDVAR